MENFTHKNVPKEPLKVKQCIRTEKIVIFLEICVQKPIFIHLEMFFVQVHACRTARLSLLETLTKTKMNHFPGPLTWTTRDKGGVFITSTRSANRNWSVYMLSGVASSGQVHCYLKELKPLKEQLKTSCSLK